MSVASDYCGHPAVEYRGVSPELHTFAAFADATRGRRNEMPSAMRSTKCERLTSKTKQQPSRIS